MSEKKLNPEKDVIEPKDDSSSELEGWCSPEFSQGCILEDEAEN